jgi:hypothetical protein
MNDPKTSGIEDVLFQNLLSLGLEYIFRCAERYRNSKGIRKFVFSPYSLSQ